MPDQGLREEQPENGSKGNTLMTCIIKTLPPPPPQHLPFWLGNSNCPDPPPMTALLDTRPDTSLQAPMSHAALDGADDSQNSSHRKQTVLHSVQLLQHLLKLPGVAGQTLIVLIYFSLDQGLTVSFYW